MKIDRTKLPNPVFGCAVKECAAEVTYPADMLFWWEGSKLLPAGFYCKESEGCVPSDLHPKLGPSLEEVMLKAEEE